MIANNFELYNSVKSLINELHRLGEERWSTALNDAVTVSSVPGEVLGEIRQQLYLLCKHKPELKGRIDEMINYLNQILGPIE